MSRSGLSLCFTEFFFLKEESIVKKRLQRPLRLILCLVLILSITSLPALAADTGEDDRVTNGSYGEDGTWAPGGTGTVAYDVDGSEVRLSKTAAPVSGEDNTYDITLRVETGTLAQLRVKPAAVVLVIDVSGSMSFCAECGNSEWHSRNCIHQGQVLSSQSRLTAAQSTALSFLEAYAGTDSEASRQLSIVTFSTDYCTKLNWVNVAGENGDYQKAVNVIRGLRASGGTNLEGGLYTASMQLDDEAISGIEATNVILLTDGVPTYRIGGGSGSSGSAENNSAAAKQADAIKRKNATLYTICFGVADELTYKGAPGQPDGPTVGDFLRDSIASSPSTAYNADNTAGLMEAFEAITASIITGLDGSGWTATDPMANGIHVIGDPPEYFTSGDGSTYTWSLQDPEIRTEGNVTVYIYTCTYRITFDVQFEGFVEGRYYPTNAPTSLNIDGQQYAFPVPGVTGVLPRTSVSVSKRWEDCGDQDGIRPDSVTLQLKKDGVDFGDPVTLNADSGWSYTWENLIEKSEGRTHVYTVEEVGVPVDYQVSYSCSGTELTVTNTHTAYQKDITVTKHWDDNGDQDGIRPDQVTIRLLADGADTGLTLTLRAESNWIGSFTNLPQYAGGKEVVYTIAEDAVKDYVSRISGTAETGFTVVNSHDTIPKTGGADIFPVCFPLILVSGTAIATLGLSSRKKKETA